MSLCDFLEAYPEKKEEYVRLCGASERSQLDAFVKLTARLADSVKFLGKTVNITMDRPVGSPHPKRKEICYPINYGYLEGILGGDGEEQDVYLLGLNEPAREYKARIVAVIHRLNDDEDKLVASADGKNVSADEILKQCFFQEKYYRSQIILEGCNRVFQGFCGMEDKI